MQKKLIVAAVAAAVAAPAFAQSSVTISGVMRMGVEIWERNDLSSETRFTDQSSEIAFSGTEDLGGGLKAFFRIASRLSNDQAPDSRNQGINGWSLGNSGVGLETPFGKVTLGRWDLHYNNLAVNLEIQNKVFSLQSIAGHGLGSQVQGTTVARGTRSNNVLMYDTPNWSGFSGKLAWSTNPGGNEGCIGAAALSGCNPNTATQNAVSGTNDPSKNDAWNAVLQYANGPLNVGYSYWDWKYEEAVRKLAAVGGVVGERGDSVWGAYTWGGFKFGLGWNRSKVTVATAANTATTGDMKRDYWEIPVSYNMGNHGFHFVYAWAEDAKGSNALQGFGGTGSDTGAKFMKLAYDYALSKRTAVGVQYSKMDNDSCATYNMFNTGSAGVNGGSNGPTGSGATTCNGVAFANTSTDQTQWYFGVSHSF